MILASTRAALLLTLTLGFALITFTPAWPGGDAGDADDHSHDDGPPRPGRASSALSRKPAGKSFPTPK